MTRSYTALPLAMLALLMTSPSAQADPVDGPQTVHNDAAQAGVAHKKKSSSKSSSSSKKSSSSSSKRSSGSSSKKSSGSSSSRSATSPRPATRSEPSRGMPARAPVQRSAPARNPNIPTQRPSTSQRPSTPQRTTTTGATSPPTQGSTSRTGPTPRRTDAPQRTGTAPQRTDAQRPDSARATHTSSTHTSSTHTSVTHTTTVRHQDSVTAQHRQALSQHERPDQAREHKRPYDTRTSQHARPAWHSRDHRYARPNPRHVRPSHAAHHPPPRRYWYRPLYSHWYVHPYYRYTHATVAVVWFPFAVYAWSDWWVPPGRPGWDWVPGHWIGMFWVPGHWRPTHRAPVIVVNNVDVNYVYVDGYWVDDIYIDGYWRVDQRDDGDWVWVEGEYLDDGTYLPGHWEPATTAPDGYTWEPGFWDGEEWVEGFWRPEFREGFRWVSAYYDVEGVYNAGYWEPTAEYDEHVWIPGWFDGTAWIDGYWVTDEEYQSADPQDWQPEDGWDDGWDDTTPVWQDEGGAADTGDTGASHAQVPLALPVDVGDDE